MHNKALQAPKQTASLTAALFILPFVFRLWWKAGGGMGCRYQRCVRANLLAVCLQHWIFSSMFTPRLLVQCDVAKIKASGRSFLHALPCSVLLAHVLCSSAGPPWLQARGLPASAPPQSASAATWPCRSPRPPWLQYLSLPAPPAPTGSKATGSPRWLSRVLCHVRWGTRWNRLLPVRGRSPPSPTGAPPARARHPSATETLPLTPSTRGGDLQRLTGPGELQPHKEELWGAGAARCSPCRPGAVESWSARPLCRAFAGLLSGLWSGPRSRERELSPAPAYLLPGGGASFPVSCATFPRF